MSKEIKRGDPAFTPKLQELKKRFTGKGGDPESETSVNSQKQDLKDGFVYFWSDNSDVANLIKRSEGYLIAVLDCGETVRFKVDKKGFRNCCHAFKLSKE